MERYGANRKRKRGIVGKVLIAIALLLFACLAVLFFSRDWLLQKAFQKAQHKLSRDYGLTLETKSLKLNGLSTVNFSDLSLRQGSDVLTSLQEGKVTVALLPLLTGKARLSSGEFQNGVLELDRLLHVRKKNVTTDTTRRTLFQKLKRIATQLDEAAHGLPEDLSVRNIRLNYHDSLDTIAFRLDHLLLKDKHLQGRAQIVTNGIEDAWTIEGKADIRDWKYDLVAKSASNGLIALKRIRNKVKTDILIKGVSFKLTDFDNKKEDIIFAGELTGLGTSFVNPKISLDTVFVPSAGMAFNCHITPEAIQLDTASQITLNDASSNFGLRYRYAEPKLVEVKMRMPAQPAQHVFDAFPLGTMDKVKTMRLAGDFTYKLNFALSLPKYDSIFLDSDLDGIALKIEDYGDADLRKLNTAFTYQPYQSNRRIIVGQENSMYMPLDTISRFIQDVVTISEDGNFYRSKGFNEEAFAKSMALNLKTKSFKRGGSTISMQLIKNVFLSHKKTIDRKLEELILTWLMENMHVVSKRRILEVYLNIIEWGPGVYGIGEASQFYFNKHPSQLTLEESIYLGLIIPSPKGFRYQFDKSGKLKPYVRGYFNMISGMMVRRGSITEDERDALSEDIQITGLAKEQIIISDTLQVPVPEQDEDFLMEQGRE